MNDQNLKPIVAGEVRNPSGRPKGSKNRSTIAKRVLGMLAKDGLAQPTLATLRKYYGDRVDEMTVEEAITLVQANDAISGKKRSTAYKVVLDSAYGYPKQPMEHTGEDGGPIQVDELSNKTTEELLLRRAEILKSKKKK